MRLEEEVIIKIDLIGEILDTCFSMLGKYGRWLNVKAKRICFIIWAVCAAYWTIRDIQLEVYSQAIFCIISIGIDIYGFFHWKKKGVGETVKTVKVDRNFAPERSYPIYKDY